MRVLDLKLWSSVCWRSKSCKTISLACFLFFSFFFYSESATQRYIEHHHPSTSPLESFFDSPPPPQLHVSFRNRTEWKENYLGKMFEKFGLTSRGCRVCLETSGNTDPLTTGSCRKFKPEVLFVLVHNGHCPEQRRFWATHANQKWIFCSYEQVHYEKIQSQHKCGSVTWRLIKMESPGLTTGWHAPFKNAFA